MLTGKLSFFKKLFAFLRTHYLSWFCLLAFIYQVRLLYTEYHHGISVIISIDAAQPSNYPAVSLCGPLRTFTDTKTNETKTCSILFPARGPWKFYPLCPDISTKDNKFE